MRSLAYAIAGLTLLAATSANAVDLSFVGQTSGYVAIGDASVPMASGTWANYDNPTGAAYGGMDTTHVQITNTAASFTSGVAVSGPGAGSLSASGLNITITNSTGTTKTLNSVTSDIVPAGLGFFVQDRSTPAIVSNPFTGYGANTAASFSDFLPSTPNPYGATLAEAGFTFSIYGPNYIDDGVPQDVAPLYSLSGSLFLKVDGSGNIYETAETLVSAGGQLVGFQQTYDTDYAQVYSWGETPVTIDLSSLNLALGHGDTTNLYYRTTAFAQTDLPCISATECVVAYSGFGDPVGRGGGVDDFALLGGTALFDSLGGGALNNTLPPIQNIVFDPQTIDPIVSFDVTDLPGVPEPAAWVSMILGFGMAGAALRRRRVLSYS